MTAPRVATLALTALPWLAACAAPVAAAPPPAASSARTAVRAQADTSPRTTAPPVRDDRVMELGVGAERVCAILGDRSVSCRSTAFLRGGSPAPLVTRAVPPARDLVVGGGRVCVHDDEGATWCWGNAWWCGAGERLDPEAPARVDVVPRGAAIALPPQRLNDSGAGLMARSDDGRVRGLWCGDDQPADHTEFGGAVRQLAAGRSTWCALLTDGSVTCREDLGQLQRVTGVVAPRAVAVGVGHACALQEGGRVACWPVCEYHEGDGGRGLACGAWERRGRARDDRPPPDIEALPVEGVAGVTALALGDGVGCGVTGDRGVLCWAFPRVSRHRRRGRVAHLRTGEPFRVAGLADVTRVAMDGDLVCALRGDHTMWCALARAPATTPTQVRWEAP